MTNTGRVRALDIKKMTGFIPKLACSPRNTYTFRPMYLDSQSESQFNIIYCSGHYGGRRSTELVRSSVTGGDCMARRFVAEMTSLYSRCRLPGVPDGGFSSRWIFATHPPAPYIAPLRNKGVGSCSGSASMAWDWLGLYLLSRNAAY